MTSRPDDADRELACLLKAYHRDREPDPRLDLRECVHCVAITFLVANLLRDLHDLVEAKRGAVPSREFRSAGSRLHRGPSGDGEGAAQGPQSANGRQPVEQTTRRRITLAAASYR